MAAIKAFQPLRPLLLSLLILSSFLAIGQVDNVYVYGTVKDYNTSKKLEGVTITVYKNGGKLAETVTSANGKYEFNLDYGSDYKLVYEKAGMVSKNITMDTKNVPEEDRVGGQGMNVELTMFANIPDVDFSILQQPIGKCKFDPVQKVLIYDQAYTDQIRAELTRLMKEYDEKKKRELNAEEEFAKLLAAGDASMGAKEFKKAVEQFTSALGLKPGDAKATARLSDAKMKLDEAEAEKKRKEGYGKLIKEADDLFTKKSYEEAKAKYTAASAIEEEEEYPKQRIRECTAFIEEAKKKSEDEKKAKELEEKYKAAIAAGDAAFKAEKYEEARGKYQSASDLKNTEQYPKDQLASIARKLEELAKKAEDEKTAKELEAKYKAAIIAGDAAFKGANYEQAKEKYNEALGLKKDEKYPKDQLAAIDKKLEELAKQEAEAKSAKELEERYKAAVAAGDAAFKGDQFDEAKTKYNEALGIKKDEKYPKDQLLAIDKRIAELAKKAEDDKKRAELDAQYDAAIAAADAAFRDKKWDDAKSGYNSAIKLKSAERYPKDQLVAIDKAIADEKKSAEDAARKAEEEKKQRELDEKYNALITAADGFFDGENWDNAKAKYKEALVLKAAENHPKERLVAIDARIAEEARAADEERKRKELDEKYNALIAKADKAYDGQKWADALNDYKDASALKSAEQHPKDRIADINGRMDAAAKDKAEKERLEREAAEREQRYKDLIASADRAFGSKDYNGAKTGYTDALGVKPGEKHPTDRLVEIEKLLAELAAQADADRLKAEQDAAERARLEEERRRKDADAAAIEAQYREAVTKGDLAFGAENFDAARGHYTEALAIKSEEKYPKERIEAIEKLLADRLKAAGDAATAEAERLRLEEERKRKEAEEAEAARLAAMDEQARLAAQRAKDEEYQRIITEADAKMADKAYEEARSGYTQAMDVKPEETYPQAKIEQIDKLLAEAERLRREAELAAQKTEEPEPVRSNTTVSMEKEMEAEQFMREAREREEREKYERIKKLRADLAEEDRADRGKADERRDGARQLSSGLETDGVSEYAGTDELRKRNEAELAALREAWAARYKEVSDRNDQGRTSAVEAGEEMRSKSSEADRTWADRRTERAQQNVEGKEAYAAALQDDAAAAQQRSEKAREQAERLAEDHGRMSERGDARRTANQGTMEAEKDRFAGQQRAMANRNDDARMAAKERLDRTPTGAQRSTSEYNRGQLANEYPQGMTEESYTEGNKVIVRRVVVQGNKADNYTKVIGKSNTYYFKNGQSITEWIWTKETN